MGSAQCSWIACQLDKLGGHEEQRARGVTARGVTAVSLLCALLQLKCPATACCARCLTVKSLGALKNMFCSWVVLACIQPCLCTHATAQVPSR